MIGVDVGQGIRSVQPTVQWSAFQIEGERCVSAATACQMGGLAHTALYGPPYEPTAAHKGEAAALGLRADDNAAERSRVDPAGHRKPTGSTRLLVDMETHVREPRMVTDPVKNIVTNRSCLLIYMRGTLLLSRVPVAGPTCSNVCPKSPRPLGRASCRQPREIMAW